MSSSSVQQALASPSKFPSDRTRRNPLWGSEKWSVIAGDIGEELQETEGRLRVPSGSNFFVVVMVVGSMGNDGWEVALILGFMVIVDVVIEGFGRTL